MTQIELTQAELDLIQAKREEEAAKEAAKQERIQVDIAKAKSEVDTRLSQCQAQNIAARVYQKQLGEGWEEYEVVTERTQKVYWGQEMVWSKPYEERFVHLKKGDYKVSVCMHTTYSSAWSRRGTDKGYKMYVSGPGIDYAYSQKALSKAETVNKKVGDCIETIKAVEEAKKKKLSAVETAAENLRVAYPNAVVEMGKGWTRGYGKQNYREFDKVNIQFGNGIQIVFEVYADGSMSRQSVDFGGLKHNEVLNALSTIPGPISE